jgi:hypothetical protein
MQLKIAVLLSLSICCGTVLAKAEEYVSPKGYSLRYPDGWLVAYDSREQETPKTLGQKTNALDFIVRNPAGSGNINIGVTNDEMVISDQAEMELRTIVIPSIDMHGSHPTDIEVEQVQLGGRKVLSATFKVKATTPSTSDSAVWQVLIPGGGHTYMVTLTSREAEFDELRPLFEDMLASVKTPAPTRHIAGTGSSAVRNVALGLIVVGLAGAVGTSLIVIAKRRRERFSGTEGPERK